MPDRPDSSQWYHPPSEDTDDQAPWSPAERQLARQIRTALLERSLRHYRWIFTLFATSAIGLLILCIERDILVIDDPFDVLLLSVWLVVLLLAFIYRLSCRQYRVLRAVIDRDRLERIIAGERITAAVAAHDAPVYSIDDEAPTTDRPQQGDGP